MSSPRSRVVLARRACLAVSLLVAACGGETSSSTSGAAAASGTSGTSGSGAAGSVTNGASGTSGTSGASTGGAGGAGGASGTAGISGTTGTSGTAGLSGASGTAGTSAVPGATCQLPDSCQIVNDCCNCMAISIHAIPPTCELECDQSTCDALNLHPIFPGCEAGQCVLELDCNQGDALCKSEPPSCPPGSVPTVHDQCWGGCTRADQCSSIPSCDFCHTLGMACIGGGGSFGDLDTHCAPIPDTCNGHASCECMGATVCQGEADDCYPGVPDGPDLQCNCGDCG